MIIENKYERHHQPGEHQSINAADFAGELSSARYCFGIDKEKTVEQLRKLADDIESGKKLFRQATIFSKADNDDFTMTTLRLKWAEGFK